MLKKKTFIGAFILLALIGGTLWHLHVQHLMNAEPTKVYPVPETKKAAETEAGHWHGDEWHAAPHPAPAAVEPPVDAAPAALPSEELRAILARPLPPDADELMREHYALIEETIALIEKGHTLSEAEYFKWSNDLGERQLAWNKKFSKRAREREAAIQQEAEARKRARNRRRIVLNKNTVIGAFLLLALIGCTLRQRSRERRAAMRQAGEDAGRAHNKRGND